MGREVGKYVFGTLKFLFSTIALTVISYGLFALIFSTDVERRLRQENRMYSKIYPEMAEKDRLLSGVVKGLQMRNDEIYEGFFHTSAPSLEQVSSYESLLSEESDVAIEARTARRLSNLESKVGSVEDNFKAIFSLFEQEDLVLPPMSLPLKDFNYDNVGASIGQRISPFYKVATTHNGLDFIVAAGTEVYPSANGVVSSITKASKGLGNVVEITHAGGYVTRYAHLGKIFVTTGKQVTTQTKIAESGNSGASFAPHLHYEVLKDDVVQEPMNYFFGTLTTDEYTAMLVTAATTGQSMD